MATTEKKRREAARRNTRMRFEQWAKNPLCQANTVSAVRNVRMAQVAQAEGLAPTFGQSPFAIARGDQFERSLFYADARALLDALIEREVLPPGSEGLADFRLRMNGGRYITDLDSAIVETSDFLRRVASAKSASQRAELPSVVAGPTLRIPRGVMLPEAVLIIDVLALRLDRDLPELVVGEIKTYPDRGGHTAAAELAVARAQAGIYVHALDVVCEELGIADEVVIRRDGFLVLTRPGSNRPSVRAGEDFGYQAERARRGFDLLEAAACALPSEVWGSEDDPPEEVLVRAVREADTNYGEVCLSFCDRAPVCHRSALDAGDPIVLGEDVRRYLGTVTLHRALALLDGAPSATEAEADLLRRIRASERMVSSE